MPLDFLPLALRPFLPSLLSLLEPHAGTWILSSAGIFDYQVIISSADSNVLPCRLRADIC